jgi:hypothetical protein
MGKIDTGFLKVDISGFHAYLGKISDVVDIFYKKNSDLPINFVIQNHKLIITKPTDFVNKIEIDHKSIFLNYNQNEPLKKQVEYFQEIVKNILDCVGFKPDSFSRVGHAIHYIKKEDTEVITKRLFRTSHVVKNFNDLTIEIKIDEQSAISKIISTPLDVTQNKQVLLFNLDYYTTKAVKLEDLGSFLDKTCTYFEDEKQILSGLYE